MYAQLLCAVLAFGSTATCITSTFWSLWSISGPESDSVLGAIWAWKGLWASCTQTEGGQYNCIEQSSFLLSDPYMNALRAMMCIGMCLSSISCVLILFGMECSKFLEDNPGAKQKLMRICGILFLITAILTLASASWYTAVSVNEFFSFQVQDNLIVYEIGPTVFVAFLGSLLSLVTSILCFCLPGPGPDKYDYGKPSYSMSTPARNDYSANGGYGKAEKKVTMEYI